MKKKGVFQRSRDGATWQRCTRRQAEAGLAPRFPRPGAAIGLMIEEAQGGQPPRPWQGVFEMYRFKFVNEKGIKR